MPGGHSHNLDVIGWGPEFELGLAEIDQEHRTLVVLFNDFVHATRRGASRPMRREILETIERYFIDHMRREAWSPPPRCAPAPTGMAGGEGLCDVVALNLKRRILHHITQARELRDGDGERPAPRRSQDEAREETGVGRIKEKFL